MSILEYLRPSKEKSPVIRGFSIGGSLVNYDLTYEAYYNFYNRNPFIQAVINKRSNELGARGWELKKGKQENTFNDDFKELIKTSTSNTPKEFMKRLERDYDVTGNAYIYIVKGEGARGQPIGMQILDPRYIKPVTDEFGTLIGYIQNLKGIRAFLPEDIFHIKNDNDVDNETVGVSRMACLYTDVRTDEEARDSNLAFFVNNQTPSSIVILKDDFELGDGEDAIATRKKIKDIFEGGKYVGGKNKHRSLIMSGIEKVEKIQDKITDAEFLELRRFTLELVCAIYEVPKSIIGFTENTNYSNGNTQYDVYMDTMEALEEKFAEFLTQALQVFEADYELVFLKDNLRKLKTKADIAGNLYKDKELLTKNEAREIIQYDEVKDGDEFYESTSITIDATKEKKEK